MKNNHTNSTSSTHDDAGRAMNSGSASSSSSSATLLPPSSSSSLSGDPLPLGDRIPMNPSLAEELPRGNFELTDAEENQMFGIGTQFSPDHLLNGDDAHRFRHEFRYWRCASDSSLHDLIPIPYYSPLDIDFPPFFATPITDHERKLLRHIPPPPRETKHIRDLPMFASGAPFYSETTNRSVYTPKPLFPRPPRSRPKDSLANERGAPIERQTVSTETYQEFPVLLDVSWHCPARRALGQLQKAHSARRGHFYFTQPILL